MTALVQYLVVKFEWIEHLAAGILTAIAFGAITNHPAGAAIAGGAIATIQTMADSWRGQIEGDHGFLYAWIAAWAGTALGTLAWVFLM